MRSHALRSARPAPTPRTPTAAPRRAGRHEAEADRVALQTFARPGHGGAAGVRTEVGNLLGYDFSGVRFHTGAAGAQRTAASGAEALTTGNDIYLAPGSFQPDHPLGRALLAHELTHVAQQGAAPALDPHARRGALDEFRSRRPAAALAAARDSLADPGPPSLTPAPRGMEQRTISGCRCNSEQQEEDAGTSTGAGASTATANPRLPALPGTARQFGGAHPPSAPHRLIRVAWTMDDGPTGQTPAMRTAMANRPTTWFIMSNQLGTGAARATAIASLVTQQSQGSELAIHSMHPTQAHVAWFPVRVASAVPQGYTSTADAMTDLETFTNELRGAGLSIRFVRMPGGEITEVRRYLEAQGVTSGSEALAQQILEGRTLSNPPAGALTVQRDYQLIQATLTRLGLHLWGGAASPAVAGGTEISRQSWERESAGTGTGRTNDVLAAFKRMVDRFDAKPARTTPFSAIVLAHDTTGADVTMVQSNVRDMESYAAAHDVEIQYMRESDLYAQVRGVAP